MVFPRIARGRLQRVLRQFPAVALLGPRQAGKSTLARWALPEFSYFDMELPDDHDRLLRDPMFVLEQHHRLVIDEAQRAPWIFPALRAHLDRRPRSRVVLLGSASPGLLTQVSESLAGRVGFLELSGISVLERATVDDLWVRGGFPRVHWSRPRAQPEEWYPAYLRTCLEQDIPQLGFRLPALRLRKLLTMVAHGQGGLCNLSELGGSLGIDYHSVAHALDVFEGVFLIRRLPPYHANIGKRLVKSPKLYVRDTGLLHSVLGIPHTQPALLAHPKAGASFETFCLEQILLHARLCDPSAEAYFFRTHTGIEVDLLLRLRGRMIPIEIKLGTRVPELRPLQTCMQDLGLKRGYVVSNGGREEDVAPGIHQCGLRTLLRKLRLSSFKL